MASKGQRFHRRRKNVRPRRLILEPLEDRALLAAVITVNSTLDTNSRDSVLTLREAILVNNRTLSVSSLSTTEKAQVSGTPGSSDTDTIAFNISGTGVKTITPTSALPTITDSVVIDGYTQPGAVKNSSATGWNGQLLIELNGSNLNNINALTISVGSSTVRGLVINRFKASPNLPSGAGIFLATPGTQNIVTGNIIGADPTGTSARGNSAGVAVSSSTNTIGGSTPQDRNIISGNDFGVVTDVSSINNLVRGNYIGTNANGTAALANKYGITVHSTPTQGNVIGGTAAGQMNLISGNTFYGVWLGPGSNNTDVQGNLIGTDVTGTAAVNNGIGVYIQNSNGNRIGGTASGARNVISGNAAFGIRMASDGAFGGQITNNTVQQNRIGTDISGTLPLGNGVGIFIGDGPASNNSIGGTAALAGNTIAFNNSQGITLDGFQNVKNPILGNSFFSNGRLGIDLCSAIGTCPNSITYNDPADADFGPNNVQNFPEILVATLNAGSLTMRYSVPSPTSAAAYPLRIEFYKADQDGQEGQTLFNVDTYTSASAGSFKTLVLSPGVTLAEGDRIVATATDNLGNTSEFSASVAVQLRNCNTVVTNTNDDGSGSLRSALTCANTSPGLDVVTFAIPGSGVQTIRPLTALPAISDSVFIDGYSQPGAIPNSNAINDSDPAKRGLNGTLLIELSGPAGLTPAMSGLTITGNGSTVRGLVINGFANSGILVSGGGDNSLIAGNYIGTDATGMTARSNGNWGVRIESGGSGNIVGTNSDRMGDANERNLISGNSFAGVAIVGTGSDGNIVTGNFIGTDASGMVAAGNGNRGVGIFGGAKNNRIGDRPTGGGDGPERNIISGNLWEGVGIYEEGTTGNVVANNGIGVNVAGVSGVPNGKGGVAIFGGATGNMIGSASFTAVNTIAFNTGDGVQVSSATAKDNSIKYNAIYANTGLGIDLGPDGPTANDVGDADTGPNKLQNFPEITSATLDSDVLHLTYKIPSNLANASYPLSVDFFKADADGEEGQELVDFDLYSAAEAGMSKEVIFSGGLGLALGDRIVATATDSAGNTSEFSASVVAKPDCSTVVVTNNDFGVGSLREAINCANLNPGLDLISFNIPEDNPKFYYANDGISGRVSRDKITVTTTLSDDDLTDADPDWPHSWWFIRPSDDLPVITDPVTIDGYTQAGARPNTNSTSSGKGLNTVLRIEIGDVVNSQSNYALNLAPFTGPGFSTIRGLNIHQEFGKAISSEADGSVFEGNFIGTDVSGTIRLDSDGIGIQDASGNRIGGTEAASRNLINGENDAVTIYSFDSTAIVDTTIQGNLIGTDLTGTKGLETDFGIFLFTTGGEISGTLIGGPNPDARNLISGCFDGITLRSYGLIHDTVIEGNYLGTEVSGSGDLGNYDGIVIDPAEEGGLVAHNTIKSNRIAYGNRGVLVKGSASNNSILSNSIYANTLGIDLGDDFITENDAADADSGPNNLQNFPVLTDVILNGTNTVVKGRLNSLPNTTFHVEVFSNEVRENAGYGQGKDLFGSIDVVTDANGDVEFSVSNPAPAAGDHFAATATLISPLGGGDTSEFSRSACTSIVTNTNDSGSGSLRQAINCANDYFFSDPFGPAHLVSFAILGNGVQTIHLASELPALGSRVDIDGFTQPGAKANTLAAGDNSVHLIELDGTNAGDDANGLVVLFDSHTVRGLVINRFGSSGLLMLFGEDTTVEGNWIGVRADGVTPAGNGVGINIQSSENRIGGTTPAARNQIAYSKQTGIFVADDTQSGNNFLGNSIHDNAGLGIDLFSVGRTENDAGDTDTGANHLQNFPKITYATRSGGDLRVAYTVDSAAANSTYPIRVEFYRADASGQEGEAFLGADIFTAADLAAGGKTVTVVTDAAIGVSDKIVATATDSSVAGALANTSEFSPNVLIVSSWQNPRRRWDVTDDTHVVADDVIAVINYINAKGSGRIPDDAVNAKPYCDVNGDNNVAADDVIAVINYINAGLGGGAEAEGSGFGVQGSGGQGGLAAGDGPDEAETLLMMLATDVAGQGLRRRK